MKHSYLLISGLILTLLATTIVPAFLSAQINSRSNFDSRQIVEKKSLDINVVEHLVFERINQKRVEHGLGILIWNNQAAAVARLHSSNMATLDFFSHIGMDKKQVDDRADSIGLRKWRMIGENIAYNFGYDDPVERALSGWMQSSGHRKNILRNSWQETGVGISVSAKGKIYITQVFLQRK